MKKVRTNSEKETGRQVGTNRQIGTNREYKDRLFKRVFREKKDLLEL